MTKDVVLSKTRRLLAFFLLLVIAGVSVIGSPVSAQTSGEKSRGNGEEQATSSSISPEASVQWTRAEMLSAIPYPVEKVGRAPKAGESAPSKGDAFSMPGGAPQGGKGALTGNPLASAKGEMAESTGVLSPSYYKTYPFRTIGKVFFTDNGVRYVCSASVMVNNAVWTAGHCVYNPSRKTWHKNWVFVPAYADGKAPYGQWAARQLWSLNGWINSGNLAYDIGSAVLYRYSGQSIANRVGWLGFKANISRNQVFTIFGYAAQTPFTGGRQAWCQDRLRYIDFSKSPATNGIACNVNGGASGGPWLQQYVFNSTAGNYVNGINSYVDRKPNATKLFSPYFGNGAINLYNTVRSR